MLPYEFVPGDLAWNSWNIERISLHDVTLNEVEEVCESSFIVRRGYAGRYTIVGYTLAARALVVVVEPDNNDDI